ncbi:endonuclease NucS [Natronorarus salvus]|uniref:endonuclease NucS n=1 Tax=Natronorarus salvus TaxID=3117733 RepID=UPI002F2646EC
MSEPETRVETRSEPAPEAALAAVERALDHGALLTLFGRCTVEYDGRASSVLEPGDRHLMCKPDGSALVHTDEGQKPVNWQPPGCTHDPSVEDGTFVLRSTRENPDEELVVRFDRVDHLAAFAVTDESDIALTGTEADLKERILDDPGLIEVGFRPLATERGTAAGAVDVYGEDGSGRPVILELKRRRVGPSAVGQLDRYVGALGREMHTEAEIRGILVAPSVTERARDLLATKGLEFVSLDP